MPKTKLNAMPEPGEKAPHFAGKTQTGETVRLQDYRGKKVALYFYPKDDTPGCTRQACNLRDDYRELMRRDIAVLGVSADDVTSHQKFAEKYQLPFPLIADPDRKILESYGVWGEKTRFGRTVLGINRTTFLIDENGTITHVIKRPNVQAHAEEIISKFEAD